MNMPQDIKNMFAVLVVSCDNYSDLWTPFFLLFRRSWPDCPFQVYLVSNNKQPYIPNVNNISVGNDVSWSDNLIAALGRIEEKYVLLHIDDLFLRDIVDQERIKKIFQWIAQVDANCIRLSPVPEPDKPYNQLVGKVSKGTIYRASTVMSVWKKVVLLDLLRPGESAWDFEIRGTIRSDAYDGFYSTHDNIFPVINTVIKGKWQRRAVAKIQALGVTVDLKKREVLTITETILFRVKQIRSKMLNFLPTKYRRGIKEIILGGNYNYKIKI